MPKEFDFVCKGGVCILCVNWSCDEVLQLDPQQTRHHFTDTDMGS